MSVTDSPGPSRNPHIHFLLPLVCTDGALTRQGSPPLHCWNIYGPFSEAKKKKKKCKIQKQGLDSNPDLSWHQCRRTTSKQHKKKLNAKHSLQHESAATLLGVRAGQRIRFTRPRLSLASPQQQIYSK